MDNSVFRRLATVVVAASTIGLAACGSPQTPTSATERSPTASLASVGEITDATPVAGQVKVCKTGNTSGAFTVTAGGTVVVDAAPTVGQGICKVVAQASDLTGSNVAVTETPATYLTGATYTGTEFVGAAPFTNGVTIVFLNTAHGRTITFNNDQPAPPTATLGCSPGYWKNHNFPTGYLKTTLFFTNGFADAFISKTFQAVLELKGGGLNSLGRHTVSAYFNAVELGSGYPLTPGQVVTMFNAAYASADATEITNLSNLFESYEDGLLNGITCTNPTGK